MIELNPIPIRYEWLNDLYEHTDQSFCLNPLPVPLDEELSRNYFLAARTSSSNSLPFLARRIDLNGKTIGKIELSCYENGIAELDLIICRDYTGHGYGTEALKAMRQLARDTGFCHGIVAYTMKDHTAMCSLLEHAGFQLARPFTADVIGTNNGRYALRTVQGIEYILDRL